MSAIISAILNLVFVLASIALFFITPYLFIKISIKTWKICRRCNFILAQLGDYECIETEKMKRDRLNDEYRIEYKYHFLSRDEEIHHHTKAYKAVKEEHYDVGYRYVVDGQAYYHSTAKSVTYENRHRQAPPPTEAIFYDRNQPGKSIAKSYYMIQLGQTFAALTLFIISLLAAGGKILFGGWILAAALYLSMVAYYGIITRKIRESK